MANKFISRNHGFIITFVFNRLLVSLLYSKLNIYTCMINNNNPTCMLSSALLSEFISFILNKIITGWYFLPDKSNLS